MLNDDVEAWEEDANDDMEARLARAIQNAFMALESAQQAGEGGDHARSFALYDEGIRCLQEGKRLKRQLGDEPSAQLLHDKALEFFEARQTAKELSDDAATGTAAPAPEGEEAGRQPCPGRRAAETECAAAAYPQLAGCECGAA